MKHRVESLTCWIAPKGGQSVSYKAREANYWDSNGERELTSVGWSKRARVILLSQHVRRWLLRVSPGGWDLPEPLGVVGWTEAP